jgi:hypothetical protein
MAFRPEGLGTPLPTRCPPADWSSHPPGPRSCGASGQWFPGSSVPPPSPSPRAAVSDRGQSLEVLSVRMLWREGGGHVQTNLFGMHMTSKTRSHFRQAKSPKTGGSAEEQLPIHVTLDGARQKGPASTANCQPGSHELRFIKSAALNVASFACTRTRGCRSSSGRDQCHVDVHTQSCLQACRRDPHPISLRTRQMHNPLHGTASNLPQATRQSALGASQCGRLSFRANASSNE